MIVVDYIFVSHVLNDDWSSALMRQELWIAFSSFTERLTHLLLMFFLHTLDYWFECTFYILHSLIVLMHYSLSLHSYLLTSIRLLINLILLSLKPLFQLANSLVLIEFVDLILKNTRVSTLPLFATHLLISHKPLLNLYF